MLFVGRESQGSETNETELLLCQACNSAFGPLSRHPTALQVSAHLLQQTTSSAWLGGKLSGKLRWTGSGGDVQGLMLPLGPAPPSGG